MKVCAGIHSGGMVVGIAKLFEGFWMGVMKKLCLVCTCLAKIRC